MVNTVGETILFGDERVRTISTPSHTPEGRCYFWRDRLCGGAG